MRRKRNTKVKRKSIITYILPLMLVLMVGVSILGGSILNENKTKVDSKNRVAIGYMAEEIEKLIKEDDENLVLNKYLVTDNMIEKIKENTTIDDFKKDFERELKVYTDDTMQEELQDGIIKTGMVAEDGLDIYKLIVSGDVNRDGKVNQIDISKIIRRENTELCDMKASEYGKEEIANKIVYGKYDLGEVKEVIKPEIQVISGNKGNNDWYTSDVEIKINSKDGQGIKTVYKIKGTQEKEETQIQNTETITLSQDGVYKIIAYTYGEHGNKSRIESKIIKVNKTGIEAVVSYSTTEDTTDLVVATVSFNKDGITIVNNDGKYTYEFTENGEFTFEYIDEAGRTGSITATVDWIKKKEIIGSDGEWKYFVNKDSTIQLTQYIGNKTELTVPASYDGYEVYAIGNQYATETTTTCYNVFGEKSLSNTTITKLTIENGIKEIKTGAFFKCKALTGDLVIPNSITSIGYAAFVNCTGLNGTLTLSENLEEIKFGAFNGCKNIKGDLNIPERVESIGGLAFNGCSGLIGDLNIPERVESIGEFAFNGCSGFNGTLTLPTTLRSIGSAAFQNCSGLIGDLNIPEGMESIENHTFTKCSGFNGILTLPSTLKSIGEYAFVNCSSLKGDLIIPDSVTNIGECVFQNCSGFTGNLHISEMVEVINAWTFNGCSNLTGNLVIPNSVTRIEKAAFQNCEKMNGTLTLSNKLTTIEDGAFNNCKGLTGDLIIPDSVTNIAYIAFQNLTSMTGKLVLSNNIKNIAEWAFYDDKFTGNLELPEGLETLGEGAFGKNLNFENKIVVIPSTLKKIGKDCNFNGQNLGLSTHDFYNFGRNVANFEAFEVADGNENFVAIDGVLYTKDKKDLYHTQEIKDATYEILEGVVTLDELSIASNMILQTLIIPDSLSIDVREQFIRIEDTHVLTASLYNYNAIQNIEVKDTNPKYTSVDGVLYTKDLKELVYISSGREKEVVIPDGVETIREKSIYFSQAGKKVPRIYIPASVVNISDNAINFINNGFIENIEVSEDNPIFTVNSNKLIKK